MANRPQQVRKEAWGRGPEGATTPNDDGGGDGGDKKGAAKETDMQTRPATESAHSGTVDGPRRKRGLFDYQRARKAVRKLAAPATRLDVPETLPTRRRPFVAHSALAASHWLGPSVH